MDLEEILEGMHQSCELLPGELVVEILSWLPVKSLLRFKSVCKSWGQLVQSPTFMTMHLNHSEKKVSLLLTSSDPQVKNLFFHKFSDGIVSDIHSKFSSDLQVVGCSNGLVCLVSLWGSIYVVWNPATREFINLPPPELGSILELNDLLVNITFKFIPNINEFKLSMIFHFTNIRTSRIELFTWSTNSWKTIQGNYLSGVGLNDTRVSSWIGTGYEESTGKYKFRLCFDILEEKFVQIPMPHSSAPRYFAILKQSLAVFTQDNRSFDVWKTEIASDGAITEWTKLFTIGSIPKKWEPMGFWLNDEIVFCKRTKSYSRDLVLYDVHTRKFKDLPIGELQIWSFRSYVESLFPLKCRR